MVAVYRWIFLVHVLVSKLTYAVDQDINAAIIELVYNSSAGSSQPAITPAQASIEFLRDFIQSHGSFPGYKFQPFYETVLLEEDEEEVCFDQSCKKVRSITLE